jgi:O-antigen/teichoic acid export membrane protein
MADIIKRIGQNTLFNFLSTSIRLGTNLLLFICIARYYGIEDFGYFTTAHTFATLFLVLADFGFDMLVTLEVVQNRNTIHIIARTFLSIKIVIVSIVVVMMVIVTSVSNINPTTRSLLTIFIGYVIFSTLTTFFFAVFKGVERFYYETAISAFTNSIALILLILCGMLHLPLYTFAIIFIFTRLIAFILAIYFSARVIPKYWFHFSLKEGSVVWKKVAVYGLYFLCGNLYYQADTVVLALCKGETQVGIYQAVFKIAALTLVIPDICAGILLPSLSRLYLEEKSQWIRIGHMMFKLLFIAGFSIAIVSLVFAEPLLQAIYKINVFQDSIPVMRIFALIIFIRFISEPFGILLTTSGQQSKRLVIIIFATIINLTLNIIVIPSYGVNGAALVSLFTNIFVGLAYLVASAKFSLEWFNDHRLWFLVVSLSIITSIVIYEKLYDNIVYGVIVFIICLISGFSIGSSKKERRSILNLVSQSISRSSFNPQ